MDYDGADTQGIDMTSARNRYLIPIMYSKVTDRKENLTHQIGLDLLARVFVRPTANVFPPPRQQIGH